MRPHLVFLAILLAVFGAFAALGITLYAGRALPLRNVDREIADILDSFQKEHRPDIEVPFTALYGGDGLQALRAPRALSVSSTAPVERDLLARAQDDDSQRVCLWDEKGMGSGSGAELDARFLELLRTGQGRAEDFLNPLRFSRNGRSYAYRLVEEGPPLYRQRAWVEAHITSFGATELAEILPRFGISNPALFLITRLDGPAREAVLRGHLLILTPEYLLVRDQSQFAFSPLRYRAYNIAAWREALARSPYALVPLEENPFCLRAVGDLCWTYNARHAMTYLYRYSLGALGTLAITFAFLLGSYLRHLRLRSREQHRQTLALQVLSHEFRTPVSAQLLLLERLRSHEHALAPEAQDYLTRLAGETYRLQRILEVSQTYLRARGRIPFRSVEINSVNQWIAEFAAAEDAAFDPLAIDRSVVTDPFWLRFVLTSLVQNAHAHGKAPVTLLLEERRGRIHFTVQDAGHCAFSRIGEMTDAFVKGPKSQGLGLGLNIVQHVVREWGGEFLFARAPTRFTLALAAGKEGR